MKVEYLYHSGIVFELEKSILVVDYFQPGNKSAVLVPEMERILNIPKKIYVLSSHVHADHFDPEILKWQQRRPDILYVLSSDIRSRVEGKMKNAVSFLSEGETFSDGSICVKAFGSTDEGVSFYIQSEGWALFHAGDLNNWHWNEESTEEEIRESEDAYQRELNDISAEVKDLDVLCFPVDPRLGKDYMKGVAEFVSQIKTRFLVPIHFSSEGFSVIAALCSRAEELGTFCWSIRKECDYMIVNR